MRAVRVPAIGFGDVVVDLAIGAVLFVVVVAVTAVLMVILQAVLPGTRDAAVDALEEEPVEQEDGAPAPPRAASSR